MLIKINNIVGDIVMDHGLQLYTYYGSSCAYRIRIALNLKEIDYESVFIDISTHANECTHYLNINPQGMVPTLYYGKRALTQSMAILEYLDETYPDPALMPANSRDRARVRAISQIIVSDIQPLNSLRVHEYFHNNLNLDEEVQKEWCIQWMSEGFIALEAMLADNPAMGVYCMGDTLSLADVCLVPQVKYAIDCEFDMCPYPEIQRIYDECMYLHAFSNAAPEQQADAK